MIIQEIKENFFKQSETVHAIEILKGGARGDKVLSGTIVVPLLQQQFPNGFEIPAQEIYVSLSYLKN